MFTIRDVDSSDCRPYVCVGSEHTGHAHLPASSLQPYRQLPLEISGSPCRITGPFMIGGGGPESLTKRGVGDGCELPLRRCLGSVVVRASDS